MEVLSADYRYAGFNKCFHFDIRSKGPHRYSLSDVTNRGHLPSHRLARTIEPIRKQRPKLRREVWRAAFHLCARRAEIDKLETEIAQCEAAIREIVHSAVDHALWQLVRLLCGAVVLIAGVWGVLAMLGIVKS